MSRAKDIEAMNNDEELRRAIQQLAPDGKAGCKSLLELARQKDVGPGQIGRLCNEMNIKIRGCQLGCFR